MMHEAVFSIITEDAGIIQAALSPESETEELSRSEGTCVITGPDSMEIRIKADDITALRAALNTWLRLLLVASEMVVISKNCKDQIR